MARRGWRRLGRGSASATSTRATRRSRTRSSSSVSPRSPFRPPGRMSGSRRARVLVSRQRASTPPVASSTATTTATARRRSGRSSSACSTSRRALPRLRGRTATASPARAVRARVGLRARRRAHQQGVVPGRVGAARAQLAHVRRHHACESGTSPSRATRSRSASARRTASSCGERSRTRALADGVEALLELPNGSRLFRFERDGELVEPDVGAAERLPRARISARGYTAKDFRTWGGTLLAATELESRGPAETEAEAKRTLAAVMRHVGEELGNTAAVARASYVSPVVVEQYLAGRTLADFRSANGAGPEAPDRCRARAHRSCSKQRSA